MKGEGARVQAIPSSQPSTLSPTHPPIGSPWATRTSPCRTGIDSSSAAPSTAAATRTNGFSQLIAGRTLGIIPIDQARAAPAEVDRIQDLAGIGRRDLRRAIA